MIWQILITSTVMVFPAVAGAEGWKVITSKSAIDDSKMIILWLKADGPISGWPNKTVIPTLILRCEEGKTEAYIVTGMHADVESDGVTGTIRFDKEKAYELKFGESTDHESLFFRDAQYMIAVMMEFRTMLFRFTPFNSSPTMTTFNLRGLNKVVRQLSSLCEWDPDVYRDYGQPTKKLPPELGPPEKTTEGLPK